MLRITLAVCCFLSLYCASDSLRGWSLQERWWLHESKEGTGVTRLSEWELRQRFLLNVLLQVHKPLLQQELIEMGHELNENPSEYMADSWPLLEDFMLRVHKNRILRPYTIYSQLHEEVPQQLLGVYRFLVLAKDWQSFQRNVCYARSRFHPVLFTNALLLAIEDRADGKDLAPPAMHEVLPQLYYEKMVIRAALRVNWQNLVPGRPISLKRSWKNMLLGILPQGQAEENQPMLGSPLAIRVKPLKDSPKLSLDVELNSYWNHLISRLLVFTEALKNNGFVSYEWKRVCTTSQSLMQNIKQFVSLHLLEALAIGRKSEELVVPALLTTGGVPFKATVLKVQAVQQLISEAIDILKSEIDNQLKNNQEAQSMCAVGLVITTQFIQICRRLSLVINGNIEEPNLLGMATSSLRDPIFRSLLFQLAQLIVEYEGKLQAQSFSEQGLLFQKIRVSHLETFEQIVDTDLINLVDQQLLQSQRNNLRLLRRSLVARQLRMNHKPFNITFELFSPTPMGVLVRSYLLQPGENHPHLHLDSFICELTNGINMLERQFPTAAIEHTLSDLYAAKQPFNGSKICFFPQHLLLPRGTVRGLGLQLLVQILPWNNTQTSQECPQTSSAESWIDSILASAHVDVTIHHQSYTKN